MRLRFFCSSFMSSLDCATVVFLLFVCVFFGARDYGFSTLHLCLLWAVTVCGFLLFLCVFFGPYDCGFSTFHLWAVWLWFFCSSFMSSVVRAIVGFLLFVYVFFAWAVRLRFFCSSFVSSLGHRLVGHATEVFLLFVYFFFGLCDCSFSAFRLRLLWAVRLWFFCSPFTPSVGRAIVVFLRFVVFSVGRTILVLPAVHLLSFFTTITSQNSTLFHSYQNTWWQTCHI